MRRLSSIGAKAELIILHAGINETFCSQDIAWRMSHSRLDSMEFAIRVRAGGSAGEKPEVVVDPPSDYLIVENRASTAAGVFGSRPASINPACTSAADDSPM